MSKIIGAHCSVHQRDRGRVAKQTLLAPQDTTELDFTGKRSAQGFGPMNYDNQRGCKLHNSLITSTSGVPVGLFRQDSIIRKDETFGKRNNRKREPMRDRESYRWPEHFNALQDHFLPTPNIEVFSICDREGDIFELFAARTAPNVHLIVRSRNNRSLMPRPEVDREVDRERGAVRGIHDKVRRSALRDTYQIKVTDRKTCKKRKATVELRYCRAETGLRDSDKWQRQLPPPDPLGGTCQGGQCPKRQG